MLSHLSDDPSEDVNPEAARKRVVNRVVDELDWLIFRHKQDTDNGKAWLIRRTVKVSLTGILREYRANIVFGLVPKDIATAAISKYLRMAPLTEYSPNKFCTSWACTGSHVVWGFYNRQQYRLTVDEVARILLLDYEPFPNPKTLMVACLTRAELRIEDAAKSTSIRARRSAVVEGLVLVHAALLLFGGSLTGSRNAEDQDENRVAKKR